MIGIDEVGRGAWAGPLVVAGCYFTENPGFIRELNDSKKLKPQIRNDIEGSIKSSTIFKIVSVPACRVDALGLTEAIKGAILEILTMMPTDVMIQLDGKYNFLKGTVYENRVKVEVGADGRYSSVMAASVLAKVERDRYMRQQSSNYPEYGFDTNVGYGTAGHILALKKYGVCDLHRRSFKPIKVFI